MIRRKRIVALALVALAVPFPALAIDGDGAGPGPQALSVSASLDHCGVAETQILCKIDAGWNAIEGAESYAVSVTSADGSVIDQGRTSGHATSVWVAYAGPGTYTVAVTAWGTPPGEEKPEVIARDVAEPDAGAKGEAALQRPGEHESEREAGSRSAEAAPEAAPVAEPEPAGEEAPCEPPPPAPEAEELRAEPEDGATAEDAVPAEKEPPAPLEQAEQSETGEDPAC